MNIDEIFYKRRTIHSFTNKRVPEIIILKAIEAANQAPCHRLTFPWRFTDVSKERREQIYELAVKTNLKNKKDWQKNLDKKYKNPSHLIVASQVINKSIDIRREDYAACSCAIQNLTLSLASEGVGSKWSSGKLTKDKIIYKICKINKSLEEIIGFIWIGYGEIPSQIKRPTIDSIYRKTI